MDIVTCMKERRGVIFYLDKEELVNHFQPTKKGHIRLPQVNLPKNAVITNVMFDFEMDSFAFMVFHDSFDKVPSSWL